MSDDLAINDWLVIPASELRFVASRSSGSGGQSVNKTSSRVTLLWSVTESSALAPLVRSKILDKLSNRIDGSGTLQINVETERSQHQNREIARDRLRMLIRGAIARQKTRKPTKRTRASQRKRLDEKRKKGQKKANRRRGFDD